MKYCRYIHGYPIHSVTASSKRKAIKKIIQYEMKNEDTFSEWLFCRASALELWNMSFIQKRKLKKMWKNFTTNFVVNELFEEYVQED